MERQQNSCHGESHTYRSPAQALQGALLLGMALFVLCMSLLTSPSHAKSDLRYGTTMPEEIDASVAGSDNSGSSCLAASSYSSAIASSDLARSLLLNGDTITSPEPATILGDTGTLLQTSISAAVAGGPTLVPGWVSGDSDQTESIAWGDVDGDGDLDLAVGNDGDPNKVYLNEGGVLQTAAAWVSGDSDSTHSIAWGDVDGDGDLDLAAGNNYDPNKVYLNNGGVLETEAGWTSGDRDQTRSIAWGDVDGDGDLDLAAGNHVGPNKVYLNVGGALQTMASWSDLDSDTTFSIAWGDVDGDGDLDLAAGNISSNKVYLNVGGALQTTASWSDLDSDTTFSIAWGM